MNRYEFNMMGSSGIITDNIKKTAKKGISFGTCLAMVISYTNWHSIFWAVIHGLLGWIYVVYYIIMY